jgi:hypothetical protein
VLEGGTRLFEVVPASIDVQLSNSHSSPPKANIWSSSCSGLFVTERSLSNVADEKPIGKQGGNNSQIAMPEERADKSPQKHNALLRNCVNAFALQDADRHRWCHSSHDPSMARGEGQLYDR